MRHVHVEIVIEAPPEAVWARIEDVTTHTEWMAEAVAIRITGDRRAGAGTEAECDTRIGPFTTTDRFRFVEWEPPRVMGVVHEGAVTGRGRFVLEPVDGGTRFAWDEDLRFPWQLGGPLGEMLGVPVIRRVWRRNLRHLKRLVEKGR